MKAYYPRLADEILKEELSSIGAILLEGPKWCGKTSTAEQIANSRLYMNDPRTREIVKFTAQTNPSQLLEGPVPRLIDEWQVAANQIWDTVRFEVDQRQAFGQFILTGSAIPPDLSPDAHSGTGRIKRIKMRPMSLFESKDSDGRVSLSSLFSDPEQNIFFDSPTDLSQIDYLICRGGWPMAVVAENSKIALKQARNYYDSLVNQKIPDETEVSRRNPVLSAQILKSCARLTGSSASSSQILEDSRKYSNSSFSQGTLDNYLRDMRLLHVFEDMAAWNPNLRSKTAIRTSPVRYFTDQSIAVASLGIGPGVLMKNLTSMGFLFENMAVRDLRVYADSLDAKVYHYRDHNDLECDCVLVLRDGRYALIEVKLGGESLVSGAVASLTKLEKTLDTQSMGKPVFKMVLCAITPYAHRRPDGIYVVPITSLKP